MLLLLWTTIYNAMPIESVQVLVDVMKDFAASN